MAAVSVRSKQVTDPLDDRAKARLYGYGWYSGSSSSSSGSEHEPDSESLGRLIYSFMEDDEPPSPVNGPYDSTTMVEDGDCDDAQIVEMLKGLVQPPDRVVASLVERALQSCSSHEERSVHRRRVMTDLRQHGYNAGLCKSKWEKSGGLNAGTYEYIDVIKADQRYLIDLDFVSEFAIARPTPYYTVVLGALPWVFVGKVEQLKLVVRLVSDAAKKSMKAGDLHLPPWRKNRYMQAKWFGPYKRTVNPVAGGATDVRSPPESAQMARSVGFAAPVASKCRERPPFGGGGIRHQIKINLI
ncbi:hypothetical protein AMTR_s00020p00161780 [Amborella trichopoda]|uniref:DUF506 domain-containing protein n=2 Tax=Amborella trichopoda TaxID=13333 RepID=W1PVL7_AMBTC|nr:hypothetical protein AMTR_s00020p00161780 [Amborella trichopoda]